MGLASLTTTGKQMSDEIPLAPEILVTRLGDYLVESGLLSEANLKQALEQQAILRKQGRHQLLGQMLVEMGFIDRATLDRAVTEQILRLRSALEESNRSLELRVQERTAELQAAMQKLEEMNQLKSNFVANISHELRTPLTHIRGYLELLLAGDLGPISPDQARGLGVMLRSADRLGRLIDDLILFSLSERGEIQIFPHALNLRILCQLAIDRSFPKANEKKLALHFNAPEKLPNVLADEERISWVILHLLDNAIKFTEPGGQITLELIDQGNKVEVSISDTGIGIPPEQQPLVFEPFRQLDGSSTRKQGGTGLGLALAQSIIKAHQSTLSLVSQPNQGSRFFFHLKAIEE